MNKAIEELDRIISETEQDLAQLKRARSILAGPESADDSPQEANNASLMPTGEIDFDKLELPQKPASTKFTSLDMVRDVIGKFDGKEFTVNHIYAALLQLGKIKDGKHMKNKVSMSVRTLTNEGFLARTHKGAGNDPHKYREDSKQVSFLKEVSND